MLKEESLPAIWASVAGWCTPTVLFIVINVVIGIIFFSSFLARSSGEPNGDGGRNLTRTASVLPRLKSLNHLFRPPTEEAHAIDALLSPEPEVDVTEKPPGEEESHLGRSVSEGQKKVIKVEKMKKSASSKPLTSSKKVVEEEEEEVVVRRPETVRAAPAKDDGVDAKADDFINRFKQQLKLQRLDSIIRYKEMINRGK